MKRFKVQTGDGSLFLYYPTKADAQARWPGAVVEEYGDLSYLDGIEAIKTRSVLISEAPGIALYRMPHADGEIYIKLIYDEADGLYYDIIRYQQRKIGAFTIPITWDVSSIQEFLDGYINRKPLCYNLVSMRDYRQPKLKRPAELKGVKRSFSVTFGEKCRCQCFVHGDNLWILHRDYFSPEWRPPIDDIGKPTSYYLKKYFNVTRSEKFIYPDTWGTIVLRSEAWIRIDNLIPSLKYLKPTQISQRVWDMMRKLHGWPASERNNDWERFLESVVVAATNYLKQEEVKC